MNDEEAFYSFGAVSRFVIRISFVIPHLVIRPFVLSLALAPIDVMRRAQAA